MFPNTHKEFLRLMQGKSENHSSMALATEIDVHSWIVPADQQHEVKNQPETRYYIGARNHSFFDVPIRYSNRLSGIEAGLTPDPTSGVLEVPAVEEGETSATNAQFWKLLPLLPDRRCDVITERATVDAGAKPARTQVKLTTGT